jgi:translation initiation factor IF-3
LPRANNLIDCKEIRLVDENGEMIGIVSLTEGKNKALLASLDLVEISPNAVPPVCKIMDFGKFKYEAKKKIQNAKKNQKTTTTKEIKLRPNIGDHDLNIKVKSIQKFVEHGDKVKISVKFRGREITHQELGMNLLQKIITQTEIYCKVEVEPKFEGKQLFMMLVPKIGQ